MLSVFPFLFQLSPFFPTFLTLSSSFSNPSAAVPAIIATPMIEEIRRESEKASDFINLPTQHLTLEDDPLMDIEGDEVGGPGTTVFHPIDPVIANLDESIIIDLANVPPKKVEKEERKKGEKEEDKHKPSKRQPKDKKTVPGSAPKNSGSDHPSRSDVPTSVSASQIPPSAPGPSAPTEDVSTFPLWTPQPPPAEGPSKAFMDTILAIFTQKLNENSAN